MYQVIKRDGGVVNFDLSKISSAIRKAFDALEKQYNDNIIDLLALKVTADYEPKIKDGKISVEAIQDSVEDVLVQAGYADVAKCYILYRKQREKIRNMKSTLLDYKDTVDKLHACARLARKGEFHRHLLGRRTHPLKLRRHHRQLLAERDIRRGDSRTRTKMRTSTSTTSRC